MIAGGARRKTATEQASSPNRFAPLGVLRLGKDHGNARLEAACCRAIDLKAPSYRFISSTLKNGLDQSPQTETDQASLPLTHPNVRGPDYYH